MYIVKMFLALTADQRFWDTSQEILFLGEWCKLYSKQTEWSKLKYETLPDVRDTITDLFDKLEYTEKMYEKYIRLLSVELNKLHSVNYSEKYWRIVAGPWLRYFIHALYVKYLTIKFAEEKGVVTDTFIMRCNPDEVTPYDLKTFTDWSVFSDEYNQYLFGCIIKKRSHLPYREIKTDLSLTQNTSQRATLSGDSSNTNLIYKMKCYLNDKYSICLPLKLNSILIVNSFFPSADVIKLCIKLHQLPQIMDRIPNQYEICHFSKDMRSMIILPQSKTDEFDSLISVLIPEQIPKCIVENFEKISKSLKKYSGRINVTYSANTGPYLGYLMLVADIAEKGGKIIETQHGGYSGSCKYFMHEVIQKEHTDLFLTWGWSDPASNVLPMAICNRFNPVKNIRDKYNERGSILLIEYAYPRYAANLFDTFPDAERFLNYISEQCDFCSSLSISTISLLKIRLYGSDFGWDTCQRWADKYPNINTNSDGKSLYEQLKESRLAITTSNHTTLLECFVANIPTIVFWNPNIVKLRPSAQPYYDKLHDVGILHYTPQSAAKLVNEIYEDPMKWWMQPEIQQAKDEFCYQFARTSDDSIDQLADVLKEQLALAKNEIKARKKMKK